MDQPPEFDVLVEVLQRFIDQYEAESKQVVLVYKATGFAQFISLDDNPNFSEELRVAIESSAIPLGLIVWVKEPGGGLTGQKMIFPWVENDSVASSIFDRICEEAGEKVGEELERFRKPN